MDEITRRLRVKNLMDLVRRTPQPKPWDEGEKIPWNELEFSERMLGEHLNQEHDLASRRGRLIDQHVRWIHQDILSDIPTKLLDLGCGPGLYTNRLAALGHTCVGIDFSPASINYARVQADMANLAAIYHLQDVRHADFGEEYGLVMMLYGEFNMFRYEEAFSILEKAYHALLPGRWLLLEPHTYAAVQALGEKSPSWYTSDSGLFLDTPHLVLQENFWDVEEKAAIERYYIVDASTARVVRHASTNQAYTHLEYQRMLEDVGFHDVKFLQSLGVRLVDAQPGLFVLTARKPIL